MCVCVRSCACAACAEEWNVLGGLLEGALEEGSNAVGRPQPHHLGPDGEEPQHGVVLALERVVKEAAQPALDARAGLPVDVEAQEEPVAGEQPQRPLQQTPQLARWGGLPLRVRVHQPHIPGPPTQVRDSCDVVCVLCALCVSCVTCAYDSHSSSTSASTASCWALDPSRSASATLNPWNASS